MTDPMSLPVAERALGPDHLHQALNPGVFAADLLDDVDALFTPGPAGDSPYTRLAETRPDLAAALAANLSRRAGLAADGAQPDPGGLRVSPSSPNRVAFRTKGQP